MTITKVELNSPTIDGYTPKDVLNVIQKHLDPLYGTAIDDNTYLKAKKAVKDAVDEICHRSPGLQLAFDAHGTFEVRSLDRLKGKLNVEQPDWFSNWLENSIDRAQGKNNG